MNKMVYAIIILLIIPAVLGNAAGPPVSQGNLCTDMIPSGHNGGTSLANDTATPPYTITTSAEKYTAGGLPDWYVDGPPPPPPCSAIKA